MTSPSAPETRRRQCVVIADIQGSTGLYERLGNDEARRLVATGLTALEQVVVRQRGTVVKSMGDGLLCTFAAALDALEAALAIQDTTAQHGLGIRAGAHVGDLIEVDGDVFGDVVNTTARVADLAKAGETLVSEDLLVLLPEPPPCRARALPAIALRGKREAIRLFAVSRPGVTGTAPWGSTLVSPTDADTPPCVRLRCAGREYELTLKTTLSIGRDPACEIAVNAPHASRVHASVFLRGGKAYLRDESANGTWVVPDGLPPVLLHRETAVLHGSGRVLLGAHPSTSPACPIEYECG